MTITEKSWAKYIADLRAVNDKAADEMRTFMMTVFDWNSQAGRQAILDYAYALSTKYGEAAAELACEMYDAMGVLSEVTLPEAVPADTATYHEVAKAVNGVLKYSENIEMIASAVGRQVKMAGVDTTMKNAIRDHAQWAWIPSGDTCAFCITLASRGWQDASESALKGGHAEHIHSNCDCTYAIRHNKDTNVRGYDPQKYLDMYNSVSGSPKEKINAMRRQFYEENSEEINAQKRSAYAKQRERESTWAEEKDVNT